MGARAAQACTASPGTCVRSRRRRWQRRSGPATAPSSRTATAATLWEIDGARAAQGRALGSGAAEPALTRLIACTAAPATRSRRSHDARGRSRSRRRSARSIDLSAGSRTIACSPRSEDLFRREARARPSGSARGSTRCATRVGPERGRLADAARRTRRRASTRVGARGEGRGCCSAERRCRSRSGSTGSSLPAGRYRLDFAWPDAQGRRSKCDGWEHHGGRDRVRQGPARLSEFASTGWRVLPVTWRCRTRDPQRVVRWARIGARQCRR